MHEIGQVGALIAIVLLGLAQFVVRKISQDARRERERLAAIAPIPPVRRSAAPAAAPARPTPARPPQRPVTAPAPARPPGLPLPGPRAGGPRWAANAVIAAEIFGPPVADRPAGSTRPGGTLGPPNAF